MDERTSQLIKEYDEQRKRTLRKVLLVLLIVLGAALIITAFLFRTQYPLHLENKGQVHYVYSHILLRDESNYNYFNTLKNHEVRYFIVYRNAGMYYEQETDFATYSAHANKENVRKGITNHSVIKESVDKFTFLAKDGKTYCYDNQTSVLKALFDASYAGGKIYLRIFAYAAGAAFIITGAVKLIKQKGKSAENEKED